MSFQRSPLRVTEELAHTPSRLFSNSRKLGPLDHLSWYERHAAGMLSKGGWEPDYVREVAARIGSARTEAFRYQVWLFDHRSVEPRA